MFFLHVHSLNHRRFPEPLLRVFEVPQPLPNGFPFPYNFINRTNTLLSNCPAEPGDRDPDAGLGYRSGGN